MLAAHMCSGSPVVADCMRQNSAGRLRAVAQRQRAVQIKSAAFAAISINCVDRELPQSIAGTLRMPHVHPEHAAVGLVHLGQDFACLKVDDLRLFHLS